MAIDFGNIPRTKTAKRPVYPIELFQSLKVNDPAVNDLWLAQGDALRQWHLKRGQADIAIVLNTGAEVLVWGLLSAVAVELGAECVDGLPVSSPGHRRGNGAGVSA